MARPSGRPSRGTDYWTTHLRAAQDEDVTWLMDTGASYEEACRRVGVTPDALEKRRSPARAGLPSGDRTTPEQ